MQKKELLVNQQQPFLPSAPESLASSLAPESSQGLFSELTALCCAVMGLSCDQDQLITTSASPSNLCSSCPWWRGAGDRALLGRQAERGSACGKRLCFHVSVEQHSLTPISSVSCLPLLPTQLRPSGWESLLPVEKLEGVAMCSLVPSVMPCLLFVF